MLSLTRLVTAIEKAKELTTLDILLQQSKIEHRTIRSEVGKAKGELRAYRGIILKTFHEVKEKAVQELDDLCNNIIDETKKIRQVTKDAFQHMALTFISDVKRIVQEAISSLTDLNKRADTLAQTFESQTKRITNQLTNQLFITVNQFLKDFEEWNTLQEKALQYAPLMEDAKSLLGILYDPAAIAAVPLQVILQLMSRISSYIHSHYANERIYPSAAVAKLYYNLSEYRNYDLVAIALFLADELAKRVNEEVKT